jgi:hypothetical protein
MNIKTLMHIKQIVSMLAISAILTCAAFGAETVVPKQWGLSLGGSTMTGGESQFGHDWNWGGELGVYRDFVVGTVPSRLSLRQTFGHSSDTSAGSTNAPAQKAPPCCGASDSDTPAKQEVTKDWWTYRTEVAWDFDLKLSERIAIFAGPDVSVLYGNFAPSWTAGPELGARYKISNAVAAFGRVNYDFSMNNRPNDVRFVMGFDFTLF